MQVIIETLTYFRTLQPVGDFKFIFQYMDFKRSFSLVRCWFSLNMICTKMKTKTALKTGPPKMAAFSRTGNWIVHHVTRFNQLRDIIFIDDSQSTRSKRD